MISIVIPVYNVEKYISRLFKSIFSQTYKDFEVICINDCSTDGTLDKIESYVALDDRVVVINNPQNIGSGGCRNKGIQASRGEYIIFIDSDDYIEPDYFEMYLNEIVDTEYDVVVGGYTHDKGEKKKRHYVSNSDWSILTYTMPWAKIFRTCFLKKNSVHFSDTKRTQDVLFSTMVFCCKAKYKVFDYCGYHYFCNTESITKQRNLAKEQEQFISENFRLLKQESTFEMLNEEDKRKVEYTYIADMVNSLITYGIGCGLQKMKKRYSWVNADMKELFPDYLNNPFIGFFKPKGQTLKIRVGVGTMMLLKKLKIDLAAYLLISII